MASEGEGAADEASGSASAGEGPAEPAGAEPEEAPAGSAADPDARRQAAVRRLESAAAKLAAIGGGSLFVPAVGAAFAAFAAVVAARILLKTRGSGAVTVRRRLLLALVLGLASAGWNTFVAVKLLQG